MDLHKIKDFTKVWIIGNFSPTLLNTDDMEIAVKYYKAGDHDCSHTHRIATEYTIIVDGEVSMNNIKYNKGDIITIHPKEYTDFFATTDAITTVIKIPGAQNDKFLKE